MRDLHAVQRALSEAEPEIVIHMAAQSLVQRSYAEPVATYATNVMGTVNMLEAIRSVAGVRAAVIVTSDKCYENHGWERGYRETDAFGGSDPYSSSKGCAEIVAAAYRRSFFAQADGCRIATVRAGNVIGGGDWARDRLVPDAMRAFSAGVPLRIRNPSAVRPWQHVLDPVLGYLHLAQRLVEDGTGLRMAGISARRAPTACRSVPWSVNWRSAGAKAPAGSPTPPNNGIRKSRNSGSIARRRGPSSAGRRSASTWR